MIIQFFMAGAYNTVIYWVNATSWGYYDQHLWQFWTLLGLAVGHIIYWIIALWMAIKNWRVRRKARKEEEKRMMPQKWDAEIELDIRREEEDDGLRVIRP